MRLTGHKTRNIFDRYNITSSADIQDAVEKLAQFHARASADAARSAVIAMPVNARPGA